MSGGEELTQWSPVLCHAMAPAVLPTVKFAPSMQMSTREKKQMAS